MGTVFNLLIYTLCSAGILMTLLGAFFFVKIFVLPNKPPADITNRINHLRVVWFAVNSPELFVDTFAWLKNDEYENVK